MATSTSKSYQAGDLSVFMEGYKDSRRFVPHGEVQLHYRNGQRALQGEYVHGLPTRRWLRWYESGNPLSEHHYVAGELHGTHAHWYENGDIAREGSHEHGKVSGELRIYNKENQLAKWMSFEDGLLMRAEVFREAGSLVFDVASRHFSVNDSPFKFVAEKVCIVKNNGFYRCRTPQQICADLMSREENPEKVEKAFNHLNKIYDELGLDRSKGLLVGCSDTFAAHDVLTTGAIVRASDANNAELRKGELDGMMESCEQAVRTANLTSGMDPGVGAHDQWIEDTVATIDEEVGNCRDADYHGLASGSEEKSLWETVKDWFFPEWTDPKETSVPGQTEQKSTETEGLTRLNNPDGSTTTVQQLTPEQGGGRVEATTSQDGHETTVVRYDGNNVERRRERYRDGVLIFAENWDENGNEIDEEGNRLRDEEGNYIRTADRFNLRFERSATRKSRPLGTGSGTTAVGGYPVGRDGKPPGVKQPNEYSSMHTCEELQLMWDRKRAYCEEPGNDWQSYDCQQMLRVANHCVSASEIRPAPDGDVTCLARKDMTLEEARELDCRRKKGIMRPSGFDSTNCASPIDVGGRPIADDICLDPQAYCAAHMTVPLDSEITGNPMAARERDFSMTGPALPPAERTYANIAELDEMSFDTSIAAVEEPVLVVFSSRTCGPCARTLDALDDAGPEYGGKLRLFRVDVAQNPTLKTRFGIHHTPTLVTLHAGETLGQRRVGAARREVLYKYLDRTVHLARASAATRADMESQDAAPS